MEKNVLSSVPNNGVPSNIMSDGSIQNTLFLAQRFLNNKAYCKSIKCCIDILKTYGTNKHVLVILCANAACLSNDGRYQSSFEIYKGLIKSIPNNGQLWNIINFSYNQLSEKCKKIKDVKEKNNNILLVIDFYNFMEKFVQENSVKCFEAKKFLNSLNSDLQITRKNMTGVIGGVIADVNLNKQISKNLKNDIEYNFNDVFGESFMSIAEKFNIPLREFFVNKQIKQNIQHIDECDSFVDDECLDIGYNFYEKNKNNYHCQDIFNEEVSEITPSFY